MKKLFFAILLALPMVLKADDRSEDILKRMANAFTNKTYRIEFTATMRGELDRLPGTLIVSGEKYYLDVYDSEVFFDGKTGYTYSETNEEVILETPDPDDHRLFANPARIFQLYDRDYTSAYKGTTTLNGKSVAVIELQPKQKDSGYNTLTVYAEQATAMPAQMIYRLDEYNKDLLLDVQKIAFNISVTDDTFRFDSSQYPDVEVIDFR